MFLLYMELFLNKTRRLRMKLFTGSSENSNFPNRPEALAKTRNEQKEGCEHDAQTFVFFFSSKALGK